MSEELLADLIAYHREQARLSEELGRLARDVALLAAQVADLRRSWPTDPAHLILIDEERTH
jgi:hypothetical protein